MVNKLIISRQEISLKEIPVKNPGINNIYYRVDKDIHLGDLLYINSDLVICEHYDEAFNSIILSFGYMNNDKFISLFEFCDGYQPEISFGEIKWRNE